MTGKMPDLIEPHNEQVRVAARFRLRHRLRDLTEDSWIEFYELLTPDKAVPVE